MSLFLTDMEINALIQEEKRIPAAAYTIGQKMKEKKGHKEYDLTIDRGNRSAFKIIIRQSIENPLDFSAILGYIAPSKTDLFLLRRYNGKSHEHRNKLENEPAFYDFHIHYATERYQRQGFREEYYACATERYADLHGAIACMMADCNIITNGIHADLLTRF